MRKRGNQPSLIVKVRARDNQRCQWRGCRMTTQLEVHHLCRVADGGSDDLDNLITYCKEHHQMAHRIKWPSLDYTGIERNMTAIATKARLLQNPQPLKADRVRLKEMPPEQIRKQVYGQLFRSNKPGVSGRKAVSAQPVDQYTRMALLLSQMDPQKAANILNCL